MTLIIIGIVLLGGMVACVLELVDDGTIGFFQGKLLFMNMNDQRLISKLRKTLCYIKHSYEEAYTQDPITFHGHRCSRCGEICGTWPESGKIRKPLFKPRQPRKYNRFELLKKPKSSFWDFFRKA